ncbi:hypothetical protein Dip510_000429 [Elusimicrobium posterum]|uniref:hypothetical protein n=1 Tax=Elusimicrobium posterum TaxID=3116653 RepID=UPI003C7674C7
MRNNNDKFNPVIILSGLIKFVLICTLALAFMFTLSQTSFCPPNFKLIMDMGFESAVKAAEPVKKFFPKPIPLKEQV